MFLTLPTIAAEVPFQIGGESLSRNHLHMAKAMTKAGMIAANDLAGLGRSDVKEASIKRLIEVAWRREFEAAFALKTLALQMVVEFPEPKPGTDEQDSKVRVTFDAGECDWVPIGRFCEALESAIPGLGMYVVSVLTKGLDRFGMAFTPEGAFSMACHHYWYCTESAEEALVEAKAMNGDDGEDGDDEFEYDIPTEDELFVGVPKWGFRESARTEKLSYAEVRALLPCYGEEWFAPVIEWLLEADELGSFGGGIFMPEVDDIAAYESTTPPVVLYWDEDDHIARIFDDFAQNAMQGEGYEHLAQFEMNAEFSDFADKATAIRHTGMVLNRVDSAVTFIKNWNEK